MRTLVLAAVVSLCAGVLGTSPGAAASSARAVPASARAACPLPPAAYSKGAKGSMWFAACVTCETSGPRELARRIGLSNASASFVAHQYANRAVASPQFARLTGCAVLYEYETDADGKADAKYWEWK